MVLSRKDTYDIFDIEERNQIKIKDGDQHAKRNGL